MKKRYLTYFFLFLPLLLLPAIAFSASSNWDEMIWDQDVWDGSNKFTLTVSTTGSGSCTVTSSPSGINCGSDCSESYDSGTSVTLTATPDSGSTFDGWSGACSGTGSCNVTMTVATAVTATFTSACGDNFTISPTSKSFDAAGGTGSVSVTAPASTCTWGASVDSNSTSWITITSGSSGTGNGTVSYKVSENTGTAARTGTITIAGKTFTVTQDGAECKFTLSETSKSFSASGGTGSVTVTPSGSTCAWTASVDSSFAGWISVTSGSSSTGTGTVNYTVAENTDTGARTGKITIAGHSFEVTQEGACGFTLTPASQTFTTSAGTGSFAIDASDSACAWTATSSDSTWLGFTTTASGTGDATVGYSVTENTGSDQRSGTITITGSTSSSVFTVTQDGVTCVSTGFTITPASASYDYEGGTGSVAVTAPTGCDWTAVSNTPDWLLITSGSTGTGEGSVSYEVEVNTSSETRTGTMTIAGKTFTVTQESFVVGTLVGYWTFDSGSGSIAYDSSVNGYDGTIAGAEWIENGACGYALSFDGTEDSVELPYSFMNGIGAFTFSAWVLVDHGAFTSGETLMGAIVSAANAGQSNELLLFVNGTELWPMIKGERFITTRGISDSQWHYVSLVRESSGNSLLYIDGELDSSGVLSHEQLSVEPGGLWLGREQDCVAGCWDISQDFEGAMDEIKIYNYALTYDEMLADMADCVPTTGGEIVVTPGSHNFGEVNVGDHSSHQTFTIKNTGVVSHALGGLELSGANSHEFLKVNDTCSWKTLDPAQSCIAEIAFVPATEGEKSAGLDVVSDESTVSVPLSGVGVITSSIDLAGEWQSFEMQKVGRDNLQVKGTFLVKNNGPEYFRGTVKLTGYFSNDDVYSSDDVYKAQKSVNVKGRQGTTLNVNFTAAGLTGKYLIVVIDADNIVTEYDEDNNVVISPMMR